DDPVQDAINGDPTALQIWSAAIQVQSTVTQITAVGGADVIGAIADQIIAQTFSNLGDPNVMLPIATQSLAVGVVAIPAVTQVTSAANANIQPIPGNNLTVTVLAQNAAVAQGEATTALVSYSNGTTTLGDLTDTYVTNLDTQVAAAPVFADA